MSDLKMQRKAEFILPEISPIRENSINATPFLDFKDDTFDRDGLKQINVDYNLEFVRNFDDYDQ